MVVLPAITDEFSMEFSGSREPARPGAICPMNSASGDRSIGSFSDGREPDFGMFCSKPWQKAKPFQTQFK